MFCELKCKAQAPANVKRIAMHNESLCYQCFCCYNDNIHSSIFFSCCHVCRRGINTDSKILDNCGHSLATMMHPAVLNVHRFCLQRNNTCTFIMLSSNTIKICSLIRCQKMAVGCLVYPVCIFRQILHIVSHECHQPNKSLTGQRKKNIFFLH